MHVFTHKEEIGMGVAVSLFHNIDCLDRRDFFLVKEIGVWN